MTTPSHRRIASARRAATVAAAVAVVAASSAAAGLVAPASADTGSAPAFRAPIYVDTQLAGSEGFVMESSKTHTLIYVTHEGTTLLYRGGLQNSPTGDTDFASTYRNQVNLWTSSNDGTSWQRANFNGTGFFTNPAENTGFSDPDITEDGNGNVYITGIDLANDALVSSPDGGASWPTGTAQCHEGDRPWLAGGPGQSVFLADNSEEYGHIIVRSTDGGATCSSAFATGTSTDGYEGNGKIVYDATTDTIWEAATNGSKVGAIALPHAMAQFDSGSPGTVVAHPVDTSTTINSFWKSQLAESPDGTLYIVWTTDDRTTGTGGCSGAATPAPNSVLLSYSNDHGATWSVPTTVAHPGTTTLFPWLTAGTNGRLAVAWYQYDQVTDLNCAPATAAMSVKLATLSGANTPSPTIVTVDPLGRPMHYGQVCDNGTTCVASGQDRRLGEFFTLNQDDAGCVMVATGDTTMTDPTTGGPLPTSRGLYTVQDRGTSLTGQDCAVRHPDAVGANLPETPAPAVGGLLGLLAVATGAVWRRHRRLRAA